MADKGTVGAGLRTGWVASSFTNVTPASPLGFVNGTAYGAVAKTLNDGVPQQVNPILHRRGQMLTGDPLLTSD